MILRGAQAAVLRSLWEQLIEQSVDHNLLQVLASDVAERRFTMHLQARYQKARELS